MLLQRVFFRRVGKFSMLRSVLLCAFTLFLALRAVAGLDLCPATNFLVECALSQDKSDADFFHPSKDEPWKRCVPKKCSPYPYPNHANIEGGDGEHVIGNKVIITCKAGYKLSNEEDRTTTECLESCLWSHTPYCEPVSCPARPLGEQERLLDGSTILPVTLTGGEVTVKCQDGHRAKSWTPSYEACPTTFLATCGEAGEWEIADECTPVLCLPFPSDHQSLRCNDQDCSDNVKGTVVAKAVPTSGAADQESFEYLDAVSISCNYGYVLYGTDDQRMSRSRSVCADGCLFTQVQSQCKPGDNACYPLVPTGSVVIDNDGKALKASCPHGEVFLDHPVGKCQAEELKTAACVGFENAEHVEVATGTVTAVASGNFLNIELPASLDGLELRNMIVKVGSEKRYITAMNWNDKSLELGPESLPQGAVQMGDSFLLLSEWDEDQTALVCKPKQCPGFTQRQGDYIPLDENAAPHSTPVEINQEIAVHCKEGFYAVPLPQALASNDDLDTLPTSYTAKCNGCGYEVDRHCVPPAPLKCDPHMLTTSELKAEPPGETSPGEQVMVTCKENFEVSGTPHDKEYTRTCVDGSLSAETTGSCVRTTCPIQVDPSSKFLMASSFPDFSSTFFYGGNKHAVRCQTGYKANAPDGLEGCSDQVWMRCNDKTIEFSADESSWSESSPCTRHCGQESDTCPNLSCKDANDQWVPRGTTENVRCLMGQRAVPANRSHASCESDTATFYARACDHCEHWTSEKHCIEMSCPWPGEEPHGSWNRINNPVAERVLFGIRVEITCDAGYEPRPWDQGDTKYAIECSNDCMVGPTKCLSKLTTDPDPDPDPDPTPPPPEGCDALTVANSDTVDTTLTSQASTVACSNGFWVAEEGNIDMECAQQFSVRCADTDLEYFRPDGNAANALLTCESAATIACYCPAAYMTHAIPATVRIPMRDVETVTCEEGYKVSGTQDKDCTSTFEVRCDNGQLEYRLAAPMAWDSAPLGCTPRCGRATDVCASGLSCKASDLQGVAANAGAGWEWLSHDESGTVTCQAGYRAALPGAAATCNLPLSFDATCKWCGLEAADGMACRPEVCEASAADDEHASLSIGGQAEDVGGAVEFGEEAIWTCKAGYRASSSESHNPPSNPKSYSRECRAGCLLEATDLSCRPVQCPAIEVQDATETATTLTHTEIATVTCKTGYQIQHQGGKGQECKDEMKIKCTDGALAYQLPGSTEWTSEAPHCERHCGQHTDSCSGGLSCRGEDAGEVVAGPSGAEWSWLAHGASGVVKCDPGYRPVPESTPETDVKCDLAFTLEVSCSQCALSLAQDFACKKVQCSAGENTIDPNGNNPATRTGFRNSVTVACLPGFHATSAADPVGDPSVRSYTLECEADCSFGNPEQKRCSQTSCPDLAVDNAVVSLSLSPGDTTTVSCNAGYQVHGAGDQVEGQGAQGEVCVDSFSVKCTIEEGALVYRIGTGAWSPGALRCVRHCGKETDACASRSCKAFPSEQSNAESSWSEWLAHGQQGVTTCADGYRAVPAQSSIVSCSEPKTISVACSHCEITSVSPDNLQCKPESCTWGANGNPDPRNAVHNPYIQAGETAEITCNTGYRASSTELPQASEDSRSYRVACLPGCRFAESQLECQKVTCGTYATEHATISTSGPGGVGGEQLHMERVLDVQCDPGYEAKDDEDQHRCSFQVECFDGVFRFRLDSSFEWQEDELKCERHCGRLTDAVCRQYSCPHDSNVVPNTNAADSSGFTAFGSTQTLTCADGYRAVGVNEGLAYSTCGHAQAFDRWCTVPDLCLFETEYQCKPLKCKTDLNDAHGRKVSDPTDPFVTVQCNAGYRATAPSSQYSLGSDPSEYTVPCEDVCDDSVKQQCKPVTCFDELADELQRGSVTNDFGQALHVGTRREYQCDLGYRAKEDSCSSDRWNATLGDDCQWDYMPCEGIYLGDACYHTDDAVVKEVFASEGFMDQRSFSCLPGFAAVLVEDETVPEMVLCAPGLPTSYTVYCNNCRKVGARKCVPLACPVVPQTLDPNAERWIETAEAAPVFGFHLSLCKKGFRGMDAASATFCGVEADGTEWCLPDAPRLNTEECSVDPGTTTCGFGKSHCKRVTCGAFPGVAHSTQKGSDAPTRYYFGDQVAYDCDTGYRLKGQLDGPVTGSCSMSHTAQCQDDGTWSVRECIPTVCPAPQEEGMMVDLDYIDGIPIGTEAAIGCADGLSLTGEGTDGAKCMEDCRLAPHKTCARVICQHPANIANGAVTLDGAPCEGGVCTAAFPNYITIQCDNATVSADGKDYMVDGAPFSYMDTPPTMFHKQCLTDGTFQHPDVSCRVARCRSVFEEFEHKTFKSPMVVTFDTTDKDNFRRAESGAKVTVKCAEGYIVNSTKFQTREQSLTCDEGVWSQPALPCVPEQLPEKESRCQPFGNQPPGPDMTLESGSALARMGFCSKPGKISSTRRPGSCSKTWVAECVWMGFLPSSRDGWEWVYRIWMEADEFGQPKLVKLDDLNPCLEDVVCHVPGTGFGVQYTRDGEPLLEYAALSLGDKVTSSCQEGHEGDALRESTCTETCELDPAPVQCERFQCKRDSIMNEFDFVTADAGFLDWSNDFRYGDQLEIRCPAGYALSDTPSSESQRLSRLPAFAALGTQLLFSKTFPPPSRTDYTTVRVEEVPGVEIVFPPLAWPKGDNSPLSVSVLLQNSSSPAVQAAERMGGSVVSVAIYLSPSGIHFQSSITITLPYPESVDASLGDKVLWLHTYNAEAGLWERKEHDPDKGWRDDIDAAGNKVIRGQTSSFSLYAILAVPPDPAPTPLPEGGDNGTISQGTTMVLLFLADLGLFLVFFGVMAVFWCKRAREWKSKSRFETHLSENTADPCAAAYDDGFGIPRDPIIGATPSAADDNGSGVSRDLGKRFVSDAAGSDDSCAAKDLAVLRMPSALAAPAGLYLSTWEGEDETDRASESAQPPEWGLEAMRLQRSP